MEIEISVDIQLRNEINEDIDGIILDIFGILTNP